MSHKIDVEKIKRLLLRKNSEAKDLLTDTDKTENTLIEIDKKAEKTKFMPLTYLMSDVKLMTSLVKDFATGKYKGTPYKSIIAIMGGLIYFLSPVDVVPDIIPLAGLVDDTFVLGLILKQFRTDLEVYKAWKKPKDDIIIEWKNQKEDNKSK